MHPDKKVDEIIERLKRKVEIFVILFCTIIIIICCVYAYIVYPMKSTNVKSSLDVGYEKTKRFSLPLGDISGTDEYEDKTIKTYTDDWGIKYEIKERIK